MKVETSLTKRSSDYDLTTGLSETGEVVAISNEKGGVALFTESGEEGKISAKTRMSASHIHLREDDLSGIIGFMDDGILLGFGNGESWTYPYEGLWDIEPLHNLDSLCAVSRPRVGPGSVLYLEDGNETWREDLADSTGVSVSAGPEGGKIAVGAGQYYLDREPLSRFGTPGIYFYEWGDQAWFEETEEDVIGLSLNAENGSVTAGLDDGSLISYNLDGKLLFRKEGALTASNVKWESEDEGGFISVSRDEDSIISHSFGVLRSFDMRGNVRWETEIDALSLDEQCIQVDNTGKRVLITTLGGEVYLVEEGNIIWEDSYSVGPVRGSISGDGSTWCLSIQNNDTFENTLKVYKER